MKEKDIKTYLEKYNKEFIERYIKKCLSENITEYNVKYLGSEVLTNVGLHRADMVFLVETISPIIIVVELKTEVSTSAIVQVQNYIKEFEKSGKFEKKTSYPRTCRYIGIVAGKWVKPIVKELISSDISGKLSYIEFRNNEYKCIDEDAVYYYTDEHYWFECGLWGD